jgi:tetratricopeptide (TPR) repeat protein
MSITCTLHRSEPAHFQCDECGSSLCDECISLRETSGFSGKNRDYFCPACELPARMIGLGNVLEPFWNRLGAIFLYPLQPAPLLLTLVLSIIGALFAGWGIVQLLVWIVMVKYAYASLIHTAQGSLRAPPVTWELINQNVLQVFKQFVVFAIIAACVGFVAPFSPIAAVVLIFVVAACLPAIIMILVASNSILQAVNPALFVPIIFRIGWAYLLMYLFLLFLLGAPAALFAVLPVELIHARVYFFLQLFLSQLYSIICYHLMGYVLLQYHEEIGYSVDYEYFAANRGGKKQLKVKTQEAELATGLALLIKAGKFQEAIARLRPAILEDNPDPELSEKFFQLLKMTGEKSKAEHYVIRHFEVMAANGKKQKAIELFDEVKRSTVGAPSGKSVYQVGIWLQERNEFKKALEVFAYFTKHHKKDALAPEVYFNVAKLLHEQADNSAKARQILQGILKTFPGHELAPQVREYLAVLA